MIPGKPQSKLSVTAGLLPSGMTAPSFHGERMAQEVKIVMDQLIPKVTRAHPGKCLGNEDKNEVLSGKSWWLNLRVGALQAGKLARVEASLRSAR